jgi:hypothetical protein
MASFWSKRKSKFLMKLPVEILQELGPLAKPKAPKQTIHTRKQSVNSRKQKTVKKTNDSEKIAKLKKSNPALFNLLQEQDLIPNAPPEKTKITELETKLGIKDSKLTQDFMDDGLDCILNLVSFTGWNFGHFGENTTNPPKAASSGQDSPSNQYKASVEQFGSKNRYLWSRHFPTICSSPFARIPKRQSILAT